MKLNQLNEPIFSSNDLILEIYRGNLNKINQAKVDFNDSDIINYLQFVADNNLIDWPLPSQNLGSEISLTEYNNLCQSNWFMPDEYKNFNIEEYLYSVCINDNETERVKSELILFKKHNMITVLCFLKFLVDQMRENKILWGVGRGSSVASYCLYLIGVHKIDSIKYNLDINEFLR
jgi:DNA polymerase III alpha subunit